MAETFASIVVVALLSPGLFTARNWVVWSGFAIVVLDVITIPFVLWWGRKRSIKSLSSASFCDFVDIEIDYLTRQVQLLRMVTWSFLLPIYVGIVLIVVGLTDPFRGSLFEPIFLTTYMAICTALFVYIWWLNQTARKKHLEPLLNYYLAMRKAVESGDECVLQLPDPPSAFLRPEPRKPMSRRRRWMWILSILVAPVLVAGAGYAAMQQFDRSTGIFVISTAPLIAVLMIVVSRIWRRVAI
jgi:magnesium-transporting ATPase (P-type)